MSLAAHLRRGVGVGDSGWVIGGWVIGGWVMIERW